MKVSIKRLKSAIVNLTGIVVKDKAQVLAELRKLTMVKEELTEEVAHLHALLEQERSNKNAQSYSGQTENNTKHGKEKVKLCFLLQGFYFGLSFFF